MAGKSERNNSELIEEIARSRRQVARDLRSVREELDLPRKIRRSVRNEPVPWIIGAIAIGLLVTAVVTRRKKVIVEATRGGKTKKKLLEAGFVLGALRIAATLLKPVVVNLVAKKFGPYSREARSGPKPF